MSAATLISTPETDRANGIFQRRGPPFGNPFHTPTLSLMTIDPFASGCFSECTIGKGARIFYQSPIRMTHMEIRGSIKVGAFTYFRGGTIRKLKQIGSFCAVAPGVRIGDGQHPLTYLSIHPFQWKGMGCKPGESPEYEAFVSQTKPEGEPPPTEIGSDVWIGANVTIMSGLKIGDGAVIAAGAIVTKDVEPYQIVAGVPARHLRYRFDDQTVRRLLAIQWWKYTLDSLSGITFEDIDRSLDELESRSRRGLLKIRPETWLQYGAS
jgi:virginiamycin A acetyltransferase